MTFATSLRTALTRRDLTIREAGAAAGIPHQSIGHYLSGRQMPRLEAAAALAEVLDWPSLVEIARTARTGTCPVCEASFVDSGNGGKPRMFCSTACCTVARLRRHRGTTAANIATVRNRLTLYQEAVAGFCSMCEPEGTCRDAGCVLRPVSPLPFIPLSKVTRRVA